jgi:hypothetical protein
MRFTVEFFGAPALHHGIVFGAFCNLPRFRQLHAVDQDMRF